MRKTPAFNSESMIARQLVHNRSHCHVRFRTKTYWHTTVETGKYWMMHTKEKAHRNLLMKTAA